MSGCGLYTPWRILPPPSPHGAPALIDIRPFVVGDSTGSPWKRVDLTIQSFLIEKSFIYLQNVGGENMRLC